MTGRGPNGACPATPGSRLARPERPKPVLLHDTITYLEMLARPTSGRAPTPLGKLALMRAENCTVSFYRYIYDAVGEPWLWFERKLFGDAALVQLITKPTIEIFVLYVGGVPAGFFELDAGEKRETKLCYFGL